MHTVLFYKKKEKQGEKRKRECVEESVEEEKVTDTACSSNN